MKTFRLLPVVALSLAAVACGGADEGPAPLTSDGSSREGGHGPVTLGPDGLPVGPDGAPLDAKLDGRYELSSTFDLASAGIFPDAASDSLKALADFREHPTQTLVDLLEIAKVPVVPQLINLVPALIRDQVLGFIDDHVVKSLYAKVPFAKTMTGMLDDLASVTTNFELVTELDLPTGDAVGTSRATHTFTGVGYRWDGKRTVIQAPAVVKGLEAVPVDANAVLLDKKSPDLESARLKVQSHTFDIPLGGFALLGIDALVKDKLGAANLRDALGKVVDCEALATDVSNRCIDPVGPGRVCVGHKAEIKNLCTTGLDALTSAIQAGVKKLDLPLLTLQQGAAEMWDAPKAGGPLDAVVDRIDHGIWFSAVHVGKDDKPILAGFTGRRL